MTYHVDKLADVLLDAMRENSQVSVGEDGNSITFDARALARAVLLHLRNAPGEDDYVTIAATYSDLHSLDVRISWQAVIDQMLR